MWFMLCHAFTTIELTSPVSTARFGPLRYQYGHQDLSFLLPVGRLKRFRQIADDHIRLNADIHQSFDYCLHILAASVLKRVVRDSAFLVGF